MKDFIVDKLRDWTTDQMILDWWNEYDQDIQGNCQILESLEDWINEWEVEHAEAEAEE